MAAMAAMVAALTMRLSLLAASAALVATAATGVVSEFFPAQREIIFNFKIFRPWTRW